LTLRVETLTHIYPVPNSAPRQVLNIPAWTLEDGAQALLRGVSGSGKTTLFNILSGLLTPTTGKVWIGEQSLYALPEAARDRFRARQIGYVFQMHNLIDSLSARQNVVMPLAYAGQLPATQWNQRADQLLTQVGLGEFVHYQPRQLSTGQRLRVAIARALANNPRLLLADEPTAALDEANGEQVITLLQSVCKAQNAVLIVASHDPALVERFPMVVDLQAGELHTSHTGDSVPSPLMETQRS
jgi:putative ABC transport system ATP-binding protein